MITVTQYFHYPNNTELGKGNTHECYLLIPNSYDLSHIFPSGEEVEVTDTSSQKKYYLKAALGREYRINQLGQFYRDYDVHMGDEIILTHIEGEKSRTYISVNNHNRIVIKQGRNGGEIINIERLADYKKGNIYDIPILWEGQDLTLTIQYKAAIAKRNDSPDLTDYYSVLIGGSSLQNGSYLLTLGEKNELTVFEKTNMIVFPFDEEIIGKPKESIAASKANSKNSRQIIFYGAPGTGKSHEIKKETKNQSVIRTTFHPDSDYSTFVGAYKPTMEEVDTKVVPVVVNSGISLQAPGVYKEKRITYSFVKQAFLKAYLAAWKKYAQGTSPVAGTKTFALPTISGTPSTPYARTGAKGSYDVFKFTPAGAFADKLEEEVLSEKEVKALLAVDNFDFPFDGIGNFGDLHKKITVIVTDKPNDEQEKRYLRVITLTAEQIRRLYKRYMSDRNKYGFLENLLFLIKQKLGLKDWDELKDYEGEDVVVEVKAYTSLLGMYDPVTKTVYLFKENIGDDIHLLCAVYVHEMFHAYFDSQSQYMREIEEPIVECCTLCFLELFDKSICDDYKRLVVDKKRSVAICYYGFGAFLFENRSLDWMRLYGNGFNSIFRGLASVRHYVARFAYCYPFDDEDMTMRWLYHILKPTAVVVKQNTGSEPVQPQFLIIEEINRGNCAQIFGDLFQLLDRKENGFSEYPIEADTDLQQEIERAFREEGEYKLDKDISVDGVIDYTSNYGATLSEDIQHGRVLLLPPNLYIWATMNTSDQSLFPIDSAFKRRWDWRYMKIKNEGKEWIVDIDLKTKNADGNETSKKLDWWEFVDKINKIIASMTSSADKQLGYFFCKATEKENGKSDPTIITKSTFVSKVIFYLWNDVFKDYGFEDASLFRYKEIDPETNKEEEKDLTFPDFYDEAGKEVNTVRLTDFVEKVLSWEKPKEEN